MVNLAKVYIWGKYVGAVMWDERRQTALFEYDDDFKSTGLQLAPLTMPLGDGIFSFGNLNKDTYLGLPGLLADALPDAYGKALLDRWLAMNGRTFANLFLDTGDIFVAVVVVIDKEEGVAPRVVVEAFESGCDKFAVLAEVIEDLQVGRAVEHG